jgi:hypothetical protein
MLGSPVTGKARVWTLTYSEKPMAIQSFTDIRDLFEQGGEALGTNWLPGRTVLMYHPKLLATKY